MSCRGHLMHQIAQIDLQLSQYAHQLARKQRKLLVRCEEILDGACDEDEYVICQAIHYLMRKHQLQPASSRPDELPPLRTCSRSARELRMEQGRQGEQQVSH